MNHHFLTLKGNIGYGSDYAVIVDAETGVHYIVDSHGGICPRYQPNGQLMVSSSRQLEELKNNEDSHRSTYI